MKKLILNLFLLIALLSVPVSSYAQDFIKFGTSHDVDFWNDPNELPGVPSTVQYLAARGKNQITSIDLTDQNVQDAFSGDFGAFEAIVVSENIESLSPGSYALFAQYVNAGGCLIVTASHGAEESFLNNAFGFNVVVTNAFEGGADTFFIQPAAGTTQFGGGPSSLIAANNTDAFNNTPGIDVYIGSVGAGVFTDTFGLGTLTAIGWDYCCIPPDNPDEILAWFEVINRAFDQCAPVDPSRPIPTISEWGLIAMAGILGIFGLFAAIRRRKAAA